MNDLTIYDTSQLLIGSSIAISGLLSLNNYPGKFHDYLMVGGGILLVVFSIYHYISTDSEEFTAHPLLLIVVILSSALVMLSTIFNYLNI
jgi:hypothetical protein